MLDISKEENNKDNEVVETLKRKCKFTRYVCRLKQEDCLSSKSVISAGYAIIAILGTTMQLQLWTSYPACFVLT